MEGASQREREQRTMPAPGFGPFFEIFSEGVTMTVSTITTASFGERCLKRPVPLNLSGFLASIIALFYSIFGEKIRVLRHKSENDRTLVRSRGMTGRFQDGSSTGEQAAATVGKSRVVELGFCRKSFSILN